MSRALKTSGFLGLAVIMLLGLYQNFEENPGEYAAGHPVIEGHDH
jgi:hypothetical protein